MNVGYKLYREVRDFAPAALTSGELVVALMLADDANDATRQSWISNAELCFRSRMSPQGVRSALARLAARGYEFRVPHGVGKDGRPVFAAKGHATDYLVPDFIKGATTPAPLLVDNPPEGATTRAPYGPAKALTRHSKALPQHPKGATTVAPLPSDPLTIPSTPEATAVTPPVEGTRANGTRPTRPSFADCPRCGALLDPDGTCFACRIPARTTNA